MIQIWILLIPTLCKSIYVEGLTFGSFREGLKQRLARWSINADKARLRPTQKLELFKVYVASHLYYTLMVPQTMK